ncbi:MAG: primosomal protein N', partial [Alphaproteobacteria bacterium]|nr:primosomal protein N' [Alphaproteobacteria bacterium]
MPDSPAKSSHRPGQRVSVLLALPLPTAYDYRVGEDMMLNDGDFVRVPLGRREIIGVVWGAGSDDIEKSKVKDVLARLSTSPMSNVTRQFVDWVAAYTLNPRGAILRMA